MNELNYKQFGLEIMIHRQRRRMNQGQFAELTGLSRNMISLIERGGVNLSVETLFKLARGIGVDACKLLKELVKVVEEG